MPQANEEGTPGLAIRAENVLVGITAESREEVIRRLGALLFDHGYVHDTFVQAVLDREQAYPTGLQTDILGFAIPHTDTLHVIRPALAIATLNRPVTFQAMGEPETSIAVQVVMMLAIRDPNAVVQVLRQVISILEDHTALTGLQNAASPEEIIAIVHAHIENLPDTMKTQAPVDIHHA